MAESSPTLQMTQVVGHLVLDLQTTETIGHVADLLVDADQHRVVGLTCREGMIRRERRCFGWGQVASVGRDGVVLQGNSRATDLPDALPMAGQEIWSDAGERVGALVDFEFDQRAGGIQRYLLTPGDRSDLEPGLYGLAPQAVVSAGRKRMMVKATAMSAAELVDADWRPPATTTGGGSDAHPGPWPMPGLPEDLQEKSQQFTQQAREQLRDQWQVRSQQLGRQAQDQWQARSHQIADQAKGQFGQVMNRFRKKSRRLRHQLRETMTDWSDDWSAGPPPSPGGPRRTIDINPEDAWSDDDRSDRSQ